MTLTGGNAVGGLFAKNVDAATTAAYKSAQVDHIRNLPREGQIDYVKNQYIEYGLPSEISSLLAMRFVDENFVKPLKTDNQPFADKTIEVKSPKTENTVTQPVETASITSRLAVASSREEFVAIRDEIKVMPAGAEKTALKQEYLRKYNEFFRKYNEEFGIRMEYKPNEAGSGHVAKSADVSEAVHERGFGHLPSAPYRARHRSHWCGGYRSSRCRAPSRNH